MTTEKTALPVLIVEDDEPTRKLLQAVLTRGGFSIAFAVNGGEGNGEHDGERMDEAFELGGQDHINDRQGKQEDEENFLAGFAQVAGFASPIMKKTGGQIFGEQSFDTINRSAHGNFYRDGGERAGDG